MVNIRVIRCTVIPSRRGTPVPGVPMPRNAIGAGPPEDDFRPLAGDVPGCREVPPRDRQCCPRPGGSPPRRRWSVSDNGSNWLLDAARGFNCSQTISGSLIEDLLPVRTGQQGRPFAGACSMVEGIIYRYRCGIAWRDVPAVFGAWQAIWT
ncbi:transposase [Amycolatopsis sp. Hca4]|uniref:transposase n=1 Tax=Amycolatopsis sp. Hca4 TaxID=2742131 RepID=UPI0034CF2212